MHPNLHVSFSVAPNYFCQCLWLESHRISVWLVCWRRIAIGPRPAPHCISAGILQQKGNGWKCQNTGFYLMEMPNSTICSQIPTSAVLASISCSWWSFEFSAGTKALPVPNRDSTHRNPAQPKQRHRSYFIIFNVSSPFRRDRF